MRGSLGPRIPGRAGDVGIEFRSRRQGDHRATAALSALDRGLSARIISFLQVSRHAPSCHDKTQKTNTQSQPSTIFLPTLASTIQRGDNRENPSGDMKPGNLRSAPLLACVFALV